MTDPRCLALPQHYCVQGGDANDVDVELAVCARPLSSMSVVSSSHQLVFLISTKHYLEGLHENIKVQRHPVSLTSDPYEPSR